jgi:hypothetical protein
MSAPNKYLRITPPPESLDNYLQQTLFSQEQFVEHDFIKVGVPSPEVFTIAENGTVLHKFQLPATANQHLFWIAAGAHYYANSATDFWFVQGCLKFYRAGRPVGCYFFGDADNLSAAYAPQVAAATRKILRTAPDGNGSPYTTLRFEANTGGVRHNLDIACAPIPILADAVDYVLEASRIELNSGPGNTVKILTGCRIISTP